MKMFPLSMAMFCPAKRYRIVYSLCSLLLVVVAAPSVRAQSTGVGIGTLSPDTSSMLEISSTSKGVLIPRMTAAQRIAIKSTPPDGLLVYQTDAPVGFYYYNGSKWTHISRAPGSAMPNAYFGHDIPPGAAQLYVSVYSPTSYLWSPGVPIGAIFYAPETTTIKIDFTSFASASLNPVLHEATYSTTNSYFTSSSLTGIFVSPGTTATMNLSVTAGKYYTLRVNNPNNATGSFYTNFSVR